MPFFSVIIPSYNRASIVRRAIQSVLNQSFTNFELIVVDDGSSDNTKNVIASFSDKRLVYNYQVNGGVCSARNNGCLLASGHYIVFLDSDDWVEPGWLQDFYDALIESQADITYCGYTYNEKNGKERKVYPQLDGAGRPGNISHITGSYVVRKELLKKAGLFDPLLRFGENTELSWRLMAQEPKVATVQKINLHYEAAENGGARNIENRVSSFYYLRHKHKLLFKKAKRMSQTYHQVGAVDCIKLGRLSEARSLMWQGYLKNPKNLKALGRAVLTLSNMSMRWQWQK